jgi:hypothetical protein
METKAHPQQVLSYKQVCIRERDYGNVPLSVVEQRIQLAM